MYIACSATVTAFPVAVISKLILFCFRKFKSTLSYPTPCLDITLSFLQLVKISASNLATRSVNPSKFGNSLTRLPFDTFYIISYLKLGWFSKSFKPASSIFSTIAILNIFLWRSHGESNPD